MLVATRLIFKYHVYSFAGETYRQARGGPIGLRFTSIVARIVMDLWIEGFLVKLMDAGVTPLAAMKYVDDVNLVLEMIAMGTRWVDGKLVHDDRWEKEDRDLGRSQQSVTMEAMRLAADSVLPWLGFTVDDPTQHDNGKVPVLDVQVWVRPPHPEDPCGHDTLAWTFYEKPSAARRALLASSAFNWRSKLITLNMEVFRHMKNSTRQLTPSARVSILEKLVLKLRLSGYVERTVDGIIMSGLKFYQRKVMVDLQGGPPLCERSEAGTLSWRRMKLGASDRWFARRRGGPKEREA